MALTRRDWLATALGALALPPLPALPALPAVDWSRRARGGRVLDPEQTELVATIAELIIPATDTPGARAAGVHQFIDLTLAEWYDAADRERFLAGLAEVDARAQAAHGPAFLECTPVQQAAVLTALDEQFAAQRDAKTAPDKPFFQMMKGLTLVGYYTSEIGANQELHYQVIPGRYDPCAPLE